MVFVSWAVSGTLANLPACGGIKTSGPVDGVQLRPTPWLSFGFHAVVVQLEELLSMVCNCSESKCQSYHGAIFVETQEPKLSYRLHMEFVIMSEGVLLRPIAWPSFCRYVTAVHLQKPLTPILIVSITRVYMLSTWILLQRYVQVYKVLCSKKGFIFLIMTIVQNPMPLLELVRTRDMQLFIGASLVTSLDHLIDGYKQLPAPWYSNCILKRLILVSIYTSKIHQKLLKVTNMAMKYISIYPYKFLHFRCY